MSLNMLRNREFKRLLWMVTLLFLCSIIACTVFIQAFGDYQMTERNREQAALNPLSIGLLGLMLVFFLLTALCLWFSFRIVYRKVQQVSLAVDHLMRGDYGNRFPDEGEGDLPILGHQFNQLSRRLQLTNDRLHQEQERLKQLISDVSHQFKTPLSSLMLFQELLKEQQMSNEDREQITEKSRLELVRMERLIQSLLTMSRLEAGIIELRIQPANVVETLRSVLDSLESRLKLRELSLHFECAEAMIPFPHDPFWLNEAVRNVLNNAIDFTSEGGHILMCVRKSEVSLQIIVQDSGVGIVADDLPFIFQRFYQGKHARKSGHGGTGIGLSLTWLIVEQHGGWTQADSEPGTGTTITMIFPCTPQAYGNVS